MSTDVELKNDELPLDSDADLGDEYLTFSLADEEYGVDILRVQELRGWEAVTRIPNSPAFVKGVLNLRGAIVPIIDLRERFNLTVSDYTETTVVIVLSVNDGRDGNERTMGVVVDSISDVVHAKLSDIQATPQFGSALDTEYISGLADANGVMLMLLNVDAMLSMNGMG
ncbi:MAG: chemotaxis protein CheW [Gammaproteobacteria bacterium]|nr:chemotaxis protein CheW [Gammaproteobacteria bacterium]